jgi:hypothetical protein
MNLNLTIEVLKRMTVSELQDRHIEAFGERTRSNHKQYLIKRIAWRLQAQHEGDLSLRARRRAMELANDADLRVRPPRESTSTIPVEGDLVVRAKFDVPADARLPMPGTVLSREYKGRVVLARVLRRGFEYEGEVYRSLTAVTKAITGRHWNGYHFFGLKPPTKNGGQS